ncbi:MULTISPECIES: YeeE/YedE thiosulfate transporter family protein [unclassified Stenotrophomonas]|uniref:YeeE/YedE family protein n=1 Tax=unclassified Stenotrophomonas TaxID=196198 RepID=UPI0024481293|nr:MULTISPECIES: YeeE/YedE thiosulfate transporter family protein [unclassified Stenotrophomonas]MBN5158463.1 YeeE/YedE family protein [Stenotrophomonas maltophilia]MDG9842862.1 YeeE/YedE thiosulfate transporter family protein [Stenotrophomonas sp. GD04054]MDH0015960.1 YeeE/YedE thiosulfate transporter family protein [Stenotrophomonas sp. GD04028]MDH0576355.1 YeeE/YedE thiosulfate transporter family protein [Stenotrophomonas sp. GD03997]MDH0859621.1 YeeE/YedE thiosulfate transporter family pro
MNLPWTAVAGGALIGAAAVLLLATVGRVAGISGIAAGSLRAAEGERGWRWAFLLGLLAAAGLVLWWQSLPEASPRVLLRDALPAWQLIGAGLLVGFGTRLGSGCTSGHGVCGMARGSKRSLLAVLVFMACAMLTTFLVRHRGGLA